MKFGEWIKTSEQLPPEPPKVFSGNNYIVTIDNGHVITVIYKKTEVRGKEIIRWEYNGRICPWEIIAWMPYPEPYKEI